MEQQLASSGGSTNFAGALIGAGLSGMAINNTSAQAVNMEAIQKRFPMVRLETSSLHNYAQFYSPLYSQGPNVGGV